MLNEAEAARGVAASDIHLGNDASETTVKRATFTDCDIVLFCDPRPRRRRCEAAALRRCIR
jgi:hypothetical protein